MQIIPHVYIKDGKATAPEGTTTSLFNEDAAVMCKALQGIGIQRVLVSDLNVPKVGASVNLSVIKRIKDETGLFIYAGGSFLSLSSVELAAQNGVDVVALGPVAYQQPELLKAAAEKLPTKIGVHIDLRGGKVTIPGWTVVANKTALDYAERFKELDIKHIMYSDVDNQSRITPDSCRRLLEFCKQTEFDVVFNSELTSAREVQMIATLGAPRLVGAVIGHSFYQGNLDLRGVVDMVSDLMMSSANEPTLTEM